MEDIELEKIEFKDLPDTTTPVTASRLNELQDNVEVALNEVNDNIGIATKTLLSTTSGKNQEITGCAGASGKINIESGETYQAQYEGNQLVDFSNFPTTTGNTSYTFINNILNVSCTSGQYRYIGQDITNLFKNNPNKNIKFNYENIDVSEQYGTVCQLVIRKLDTTVSYATLVNHELSDISYTIPNDTSDIDEVTFRIYPNNSSTSQAASVTITKPMVFFMEGTTIKPYEPYTNLQPAPSPDYPQDIVNVGSNINLLDISDVASSTTNHGLTLTRMNDLLNMDGATSGGTFGVNFTLTSPIVLKAGKIYTFQSTEKYPTDDILVILKHDDTSIISLAIGQKKSISYTPETDITINILRFYANNNKTYNNFSFKLKLEEGSQATGYSKYGYGSIDYKVSNKNNLFKKENALKGYEIYNASTGELRANANWFVSDFIEISPNTKYTFLDKTTGSVNVYYDTNYNRIAQQSVTNGTFTITNNSSIKYMRFNSQLTELNNIKLIQGEVSSSDYQEQKITIPLPAGVELCKIGTYKDYLYKANGKWYKHKEIGKVVLTGNSEGWSISGTGTANWFYQSGNVLSANPANVTEAVRQNDLCNRYTYAQITTGNTDTGFWVLANQIRIRYGTEDTIENFTTWLSNNNVIVYYVLATPVVEEITDKDTIYYLEHFPIYKEYTNIECINEVKPDMHIDYLYDNEVNNYWGAELDSLAEKLHNLEVGE